MSSDLYQAFRRLLGTGSLAAYGLFGMMLLSIQAHDTRHGIASVCPGFVVLPTGLAVFSQADGAQSSHMGHTGSHSPSSTSHSHTSHTAHGVRTNPKLMGYQHSQAIIPQPGMLCVPLGSKDDTAWMATSHDATLQVMAESLQGVLTHNSRTNEAFALTLVRDGTPLQPSQVRVLVRMPQHDHRMPGGHGTANDPDVQGFVAQRHEHGRYLVPTVDFSMPGPWLFEIQLQDGASTSRAYFAVNVGEQ